MKDKCLLAVTFAVMIFLVSVTRCRASDAAEMLNEALVWPGDIAQVGEITTLSCGFRNPPIPGYSTCIPQTFVLSAATVSKLGDNRDAVIAELSRRLRAFSWNQEPPAPQVTEKAKQLEAEAFRKLPGKSSPVRKKENPLALGATMLRIIEALQAVELLPELLRLENDLHRLNESALDAVWIINVGSNDRPPSLFVPDILLGGQMRWSTYEEDLVYYEGPHQAAWAEWKAKVFGNLVFQREMLGVCLGLLEIRGDTSLPQSFAGRLHALAVKRTPMALIPCSDAVRDDVRHTVSRFLIHKPVADTTDGAKLLEDSIATPGYWNQMCAMPPTIPLDAPMPAGAELAHRHFNLGGLAEWRLQAYRDRVMPVLVDRLRALKLESPLSADQKFDSKRSGQTSTAFGPLIFQVVECLNAVECLPELLRLEQQLHDLVAQAEKDPKTPVPVLPLDSPAAWQPPRGKDSSPEAKALQQRETAIHVCRIYQREMLGLARSILLMEKYQPMKDSALEKTQDEAGRAAFREEHQKEIGQIKSAEEIPSHLRDSVVWNATKRRAEITENAAYAVPTPYSESVRDEICRLAADFLKNVPPEKRRAADGMRLSWLPQ